LNFIILAILSLFMACEYDPSGNNFLDLAPPEDYIPIEISLNGSYYKKSLFYKGLL